MPTLRKFAYKECHEYKRDMSAAVSSDSTMTASRSHREDTTKTSSSSQQGGTVLMSSTPIPSGARDLVLAQDSSNISSPPSVLSSQQSVLSSQPSAIATQDSTMSQESVAVNQPSASETMDTAGMEVLAEFNLEDLPIFGEDGETLINDTLKDLTNVSVDEYL